jgi:hypothetical protein
VQQDKERRVPRISQFYGIAICMYFGDHAPPHFHAIYGGADVAVSIRSRRVLAGHLPKRALALVRTWARIHEEELVRNWDAAMAGRPLRPVDPLE